MDDRDRSAEHMAREMHAHNERLMHEAGPSRSTGPRARPGPTGSRPTGSNPRFNSPSGRSWDGYSSWGRSDFGYRLIDQISQLAEEAVRGAGDLAYRLADLATSLPPPPRSLPWSPLPGFPPYSGHDPGPPAWAPPGPPVTPPTLVLPTVARGSTARGEIDLTNTTNRTVSDLRLRCSALVGPDGQWIEGQHLSVSPAMVTLGPWGHARVALMLSVPPDAVPSRYIGLVEGDVDGIQCLVTVTVD